MNYTDILHAIAEALRDGDDGALIDTRERIQDLLITEDWLIIETARPGRYALRCTRVAA